MEQKELFKEAIELFEAGEYDKSVQNLIGLYEHGYEKEQILNFLYQAFVEPNIEEFKKNYQTQADGLTMPFSFSSLTALFLKLL